MNFQERKEIRKKNYEENIKGWKLQACIACNGSGIYDDDGAPKCGACNGTGKERYKPSLERDSFEV
jgi:DnaJ-class molecular chaperone